MKTLETFIVDGRGWSHADAARACRLILQTVQDCVHHYETDVPGFAADYPPNVAPAAEVLRDVAARSGRVERGGYAQTGIIRTVGDEVWSAFVEFAPWAYDATVWTATGADIVSLSDEGSIVVRLNRQQYNAIAAALGHTSLVPEKEWRRILKQRRRDHA